MGFSGSTSGAAYGGEYSGAAVHRFDTGLHKPQRTAIREAIVARLSTVRTGNGRPMLKASGGYVVVVGQLARPLRGDSEDDLVQLHEAVNGAAPSLAVALGRMPFSSINGLLDYTGDLEVWVYALSKNFRSFTGGRLATDVVGKNDPTADPGIETVLEHAREILAGQGLGLIGVHELRLDREDEVFTDGRGSLWEQHYTVLVEFSPSPERATADVITSLEVNHELINDDGAATPILDTITELETP